MSSMHSTFFCSSDRLPSPWAAPLEDDSFKLANIWLRKIKNMFQPMELKIREDAVAKLFISCATGEQKVTPAEKYKRAVIFSAIDKLSELIMDDVTDSSCSLKVEERLDKKGKPKKGNPGYQLIFTVPSAHRERVLNIFKKMELLSVGLSVCLKGPPAEEAKHALISPSKTNQLLPPLKVPARLMKIKEHEDSKSRPSSPQKKL